jgi:hypothetical protein
MYNSYRKFIYNYVMNNLNFGSKSFKITGIKKYTGVLLLLIAIVIGLLTYKDYGIAWDEHNQHDMGQISYNYIFHKDDSLLKFSNNYYGAAYEVPLIMLEKILHLKDSRDIYLMRHLVTHLFFLLSAFVFFLLIDYLYKDKLLATIGFLLLVVNPLIYGHSFFNTKDIPFLSMYIICFMLCVLAFNKNTYKYFILLGTGGGILIDIRVMGLFLMFCVCLFFMIDYFSQKDKEQRQKIRKLFYTYITTTILVIYAVWPFLWCNPLMNFKNAFRTMARYPWVGVVLFEGRIIPSTQMPRDYSIIWFLISNPIVYLALGIFGILLFIFRFLKNHKIFIFDKNQRNNLLYFLSFFMPLASVIILHSVLYDAWRQLYFIYPPFVLMAIYGLNVLFKTKLRLILTVIVITGTGLTALYIVKNYPLEHVYFNEFARSDKPEYLRENWELDYWGTSYKQGLDYILKNDTSQNINVSVGNYAGLYNYVILKAGERKRIHYVDNIYDSRYFIVNYRGHPEDYVLQHGQFYYSIVVLNSSVLSIFKMK